MCEKNIEPSTTQQASHSDEGLICDNRGLNKDNSSKPSFNYNYKKADKYKCVMAEYFKYPESPPTPTNIKKFHDYYKTDVGLHRRHYGISNDPQRYFTPKLYHGKPIKLSTPIKELLVPAMETEYQEACKNLKDTLYTGKKIESLAQKTQWYFDTPNDFEQMTHGKIVKTDQDIGKIMFPPYSRSQVKELEERYHGMYVTSHKDYYPGEQFDRDYKLPFRPSTTYGNITNKYNDGDLTKSSVKWLNMVKKEKATPLIYKNFDEFKEKTQPRIGHSLCEIRNSRKFPCDFIFGSKSEVNESVSEVVFNATPFHYNIADDHYAFLIALRKDLTNYEYSSIPKILTAMQLSDVNNIGYLSSDETVRILLEEQFPLEVEQIRRLVEMWKDENKGVNYHLLMDSLNLKKTLPCFHMLPLDKCTHFDKKEEERLRSKMKDDKIQAHFQKSSSMVNSNVDTNNMTKNWRKYGVPNFRMNLTPPKVQSFSDNTNYGDQGDVYTLVRPTIYSEYGVSDTELKKPRTLEEIKNIYSKIGFEVDGKTLQKLHDMVANGNPEERVSLYNLQKLFQISDMPARFIK